MRELALISRNIAGAFYDFKTVLVPHNLSPEILSAHLKEVQADVLIAEAGSLDLSTVSKANKQLSLVLWVAKSGSRHMDWNDVPKDTKGSLKVAVWHELVEEGRNIAGFEVPSYDSTTATPTVSTVWPSSEKSGEFIEFKPEVFFLSVILIQSQNADYYPRTSCLLLVLWVPRYLGPNV